MIDMHLHTKWSDGSCTVSELVNKLYDKNITYAILTDHDCILGNDDFKNECDKYGIHSSFGTELEAYYDVDNSLYLHMLCYNYENSIKLNNFLEKEREDRIAAINKAIRLLNEKGYSLSFDDVVSMSEGRHLLINHLCILLEKKKIVNSRFDAFNILLGKNSNWQLNYPKPSVEKIIELIYDVGGIPVLAHPKRIRMSNSDKELFIKYLKSLGLYGIEAFYGFDNAADRELSNYFADKYGLVKTVGSDWHCEDDGIDFGNNYVSEKNINVLRKVFFHE